MKVTLESTDHTRNQELGVDDLPAIVGRNADAQVCLHDPMVSRFHCKLEDLDGTLVVCDLESMNGTYVNGCRTTATTLVPGHRLAVGNTCFVVHYQRRVARLPVTTHDKVRPH